MTEQRKSWQQMTEIERRNTITKNVSQTLGQIRDNEYGLNNWLEAVDSNFRIEITIAIKPMNRIKRRANSAL